MIPFRTIKNQEYLRECFSYDGDTGVLTWKERPAYHFKNPFVAKSWNTRRAGTTVAQNPLVSKRPPSSAMMALDGDRWHAHRIIWNLVNGPIPEQMRIDHINGDPLDNRIANMRLADKYQSAWNMTARRGSASGLKGVYISKSGKSVRWAANITSMGKRLFLGLYDTPEEAHDVYVAKAKEMHGEFFRK